VCTTSANRCVRDYVALGGHCVGLVAYCSWSLLVPRWLDDCDSMKHARRLCSSLEKAL
jgi:hypothetical protein